MKESTFYVMKKENDVVGAVKRTGIEFEVKGLKFYAYESDNYDKKFYIIDPDTGFSVLTKEIYPCDPVSATYCITDEEIEAVKTLMESAKYQRMVKVSNLYKKAAVEYERCFILDERERQQV